MPRPRKTDGYSRGRPWRRLVAVVIREEPICWLRFKGCTIASSTGDHVIPVKIAPHLALTRSNIRGACAHCNYTRGAKPVAAIRHLMHHVEPRTIVDFFA